MIETHSFDLIHLVAAFCLGVVLSALYNYFQIKKLMRGFQETINQVNSDWNFRAAPKRAKEADTFPVFKWVQHTGISPITGRVSMDGVSGIQRQVLLRNSLDGDRQVLDFTCTLAYVYEHSLEPRTQFYFQRDTAPKPTKFEITSIHEHINEGTADIRAAEVQEVRAEK